MKSLSLLFALLFPMAAFAADGMHLMVEGAQIRAMPPTVANTAAYFTLHNHGQDTLSLTGARADFAARVELHETVSRDGQLMMRARESVELPAQGSLSLENGGLHLMVMGLERPLAPGQEVEVVLEFAGGGEFVVTLPVVSPLAGGASMSVQHDRGNMRHGDH